MGVFLSLYSSAIFQEGNPWPQIKAIVRLTFNKTEMVNLSDSDNRYLTKSKGGWDIIDSFLKNKGYEFTEQMGSGYFYKSSDNNIVLIRRQYSRFYTIWSITKNNDTNRRDNLELPTGYTLDSYKIIDISDRSCQEHFECVTPGKYLVQSNCPYTSLCLKNKCNVICPDYKNTEQAILPR